MIKQRIFTAFCLFCSVQVIFCSPNHFKIKGSGVSGILVVNQTTNGGTSATSGDNNLSFAEGTVNGGVGASSGGLSGINVITSSSAAAATPQVADVPAINIGSTGVGTANAAGTSTAAAFVGTFVPTQIITGVPPGTMVLNNGTVVQIFSTNFGIGNYYNNEKSIWTFEANQCVLYANCPCADIPPSAFCFDDYLKITDKYSFNQKFCGGYTSRDDVPLQATSDSLVIKFRTNFRTTARGFTCYVYCIKSGGPMPILQNSTTLCPTF